MDSGPRDRSRPDRIRRLVSCHASYTGKTVWEHSPTRRKEKKIVRINRGVNSPINCLYPSTRGAPHGRPRGRVASLPLGRSLCASCAGHPGAAMWPQCRVATRVGPARHVTLVREPRHPADKTPFCDIFN